MKSIGKYVGEIVKLPSDGFILSVILKVSFRNNGDNGTRYIGV